jgi:hypothetical protein
MFPLWIRKNMHGFVSKEWAMDRLPNPMELNITTHPLCGCAPSAAVDREKRRCDETALRLRGYPLIDLN